MKYKCPKCGSNMKVVRSHSGISGVAYNYRQCECGYSEYTKMKEDRIVDDNEIYAASKLVWSRKS